MKGVGRQGDPLQIFAALLDCRRGPRKGAAGELRLGGSQGARSQPEGRHEHRQRREDGADSGMFPCFFAGFESRLFSTMVSASMMRGRVFSGVITASM